MFCIGFDGIKGFILWEVFRNSPAKCIFVRIPLAVFIELAFILNWTVIVWLFKSNNFWDWTFETQIYSQLLNNYISFQVNNIENVWKATLSVFQSHIVYVTQYQKKLDIKQYIYEWVLYGSNALFYWGINLP